MHYVAQKIVLHILANRHADKLCFSRNVLSQHAIRLSYPWIPLAECLSTLHISQHQSHFISSIAQQLLDSCQLADAWVTVLGPQKADADNGEHGQQHRQHNLVPGTLTRKHWYDMSDTPAHATHDPSDTSMLAPMYY